MAVEGDAVAGGERLQEVQVGGTLALLDDEIREEGKEPAVDLWREGRGSGSETWGGVRLPLCEEPAVDLLLEQLPIVREDLSECFLGADVEREVLDERGEPLGEV